MLLHFRSVFFFVDSIKYRMRLLNVAIGFVGQYETLRNKYSDELCFACVLAHFNHETD